MINPEKAVDAARAMQKKIKHIFPDLPELNQAMAPLLVERLDNGQYYYLIPFTQEGKVILVVEMDAEAGSLLNLTQIPPGGIYPLLTISEAQDIAQRKFPHYRFLQSRLIWTPCRESASSLYPFYEVPYTEGRLYVSMTGHIFPQLTPFGLGG